MGSGSALRYTLGCLLAVVALNAFAGGYYGMSGAPDVSVAWLEGSPFRDYFIPSVILFLIVGGCMLLAAGAVLARWRRARVIALGAVAVLFAWLSVQVAIIGYVSWMQPTTAAVGLAMLVLSWFYREGTRKSY